VDALNIAIARAAAGLTWEYPCLIWVADYLKDAANYDPAANWRNLTWSERVARRELASLARGGVGKTAVECALDAIAKRDGWIERDVAMQGAVMIGVGSVDDVGVPGIYDGEKRWLVAGRGDAVLTRAQPERMWEVPFHA
jgi:hypothetical protein